jgi:GDP-L-fucose synthase
VPEGFDCLSSDLEELRFAPDKPQASQPQPSVVRLVNLDLTSQAAVRSFFAEHKPGSVFLAAARVGGILANTTYPADFIRDNLCMQDNVIDAAYRSGALKLCFLGSSCIYPKHATQPMQEECLLTGELEPTNQWYAVAKIAGIKMCQAYRRQHGFEAISLMPTNLYGPNDNFDLETSHVLPALIRRLHLGKCLEQGDWEGLRSDLHARPLGGVGASDSREAIQSALSRHGISGAAADPGQGAEPGSGNASPDPSVTISLWGTGEPRREFLHVDDAAEACTFLMETYSGEEIVNVGLGRDISIKELAGKVRRVTGFNGEIAFDPSMPEGTPRKLLDVSRLNALGWRASISLENGIERTYAWYCNSLKPLPGSAV